MSNAKQKKGADLSGLDAFNVSDLVQGMPTDGEAKNLAGKILSVEIGKLHEDPDNTRTVFAEDKLQELVESITAINPATKRIRGIKTPLSVRPHPTIEGEYIVNSGHRRLRAAKIAKLEEVPVYIDSDANHYDNTVDNLQREGLNAMELAMFIAKRIEAGDSKGEVAKQIGRPASVISDHSVFFELPNHIRELYDEGICQSMQGLAILHRANKKHPKEVEGFCIVQEEEITVSKIRAFVDSLKDREKITLDKKEEPNIVTDAPATEVPGDEITDDHDSVSPSPAEKETTDDNEPQGLHEVEAPQKEDDSLVDRIIELKRLIESAKKGDSEALEMMELLVDDLLIAASN